MAATFSLFLDSYEAAPTWPGAREIYRDVPHRPGASQDRQLR